MRIQWWVGVVIVLVSALVSSAFAITGVLAPETFIHDAHLVNISTTIFAWYVAARTLTLTLITIGVIVYVYYKPRAMHLLSLMALILGCIQIFDTFLGIFLEHEAAKAIGPAVFATLLLGCAFGFYRQFKESLKN